MSIAILAMPSIGSQPIASRLPHKLRDNEDARLLDTIADHKVYIIIHLIYRSRHYEGRSKDYGFSRLAMEEHWRAGYDDALRTAPS
jgi:NTE family protein